MRKRENAVKKPLISVVMTTYQRPQRLKKAIKSVINQTFQDWELVIVDDASQDETPKVCQRFAQKDSRIRVIRRDTNYGQHTQPKNQGTQAARADLIAYLDDDNEYLRDHLQVLFKYLGDSDIVYGDRWLIDETNSVWWTRKKKVKAPSYNFSGLVLAKRNYIDTSDVLIRKKAIEAIGGWDEELPKFADWNLWVRLFKAGYKFKHIPIIITSYYVHKGSNQFRTKSEIDPLTGLIKPTFDPSACPIWPDKTIYGKRKKAKAAIFTLTMNRLGYTKKMFASMKRRAGYPFDWFVVDQGSTDGTRKWLRGKAHKLISNKENVGISKGSNQALDAIGKDYDIIIKADNDCLFLTDNWLRDIVDVYKRQKRIVISPRVEGLRDSPGGVPRTQYMYVGEHFFGLAPHLGGICCAAPSEIYRDFRWDENDFLHGEQDYIFSQYAIRQGYILAYDENIIVEHIEGTARQEERYPEYFAQRKELKTTKYEKK